MQQVNLYLDEFKEIEPPYSALLTTVILAIVLVVGIVVSAVLAGTYAYQKSQYSVAQQELNQWQKKLELAQKQFPEPLVDSRLTQKIATLQQDKQRNEKLLRYLSSHNMNVESQTFSKVLSSLTEIKQPGLWLTQIKITDGGASLYFAGRTQHADALPEYLKKLAKLNAFKDMNFKVFDMNREGSDLAFVISSQREQQQVEKLLEQISTGL